MRRGLGITLASLFVCALAPVQASANHHFVSISEVFPGTSGQPGAEFVELQMYAPGQNVFSPAASLTFYNSSGGTAANFDLPSVPSGANQRTLLAGTSSMESIFGVSADAEYANDLIANAGGGVCLVSDGFGTLDCVAWGSATVAGAGVSAPAILADSSITRSPAAGCNTLLESSDDTGSSLADFASGLPTPRPNSVVPSESACPDTQITKMPKPKTKKRKAKFEFTSATGAGYECSLDEAVFEACPSPYKTGKLRTGKHTIAVRATETDGSLDGTPATYAWKIKKKKRK